MRSRGKTELAEAEATPLITRAKSAYETVSEGLDTAEQEVSALQQEASQAKSELEEAQQDLARARTEAEGEVQELRAQLVEAEARAESAATCAQGAVAAFGSIFDAPSVEQGLNSAVAELEELEPTCEPALEAD